MDTYRLMGIVNLTDNSFVSTSRMAGKTIDEIIVKVGRMIGLGASYIDIGACSSAPGNEFIGAEEEWKRLYEPLKALTDAFPKSMVCFSIDTFRSEIIEKCLSLGRKVTVNDIFAGSADPRMLDVCAANGLEYIAMDQSAEPYSFFEKFADTAARKGISEWILDPGFGFGKTVEQNWRILNSLERFSDFGRPVLCAMSRKRMIYIPNGLTPLTCEKESVAAELLAVSKGASIIRTHDLQLHRQERIKRQEQTHRQERTGRLEQLPPQEHTGKTER